MLRKILPFGQESLKEGVPLMRTKATLVGRERVAGFSPRVRPEEERRPALL